jgi:hypothetical protein
MLQWDEQNRAVSGKHEFHVFYDPESSRSQDRLWIMVIRELGEDGVHAPQIHHSIHFTEVDAKKAANQWAGPRTP